MPKRYDIAFLGGGPAGYQGAVRAAQLGARVAVVEEKFLGGVCLNQGCIPTKAVRASAEVGRYLRRAREFGFQPVTSEPDISAIVARKERVVSALRSSIAGLFQVHGIHLAEGRGQLAGGGKIQVERKGQLRLVEADKIVISTGSRPARLPVFPQHPRVFLPDDLLDITYVPRHLLVVGGGAVGVEMATIFRELGSQVTLLEALESLLPTEDVEMVEHLKKILKRHKMKVICGVQVAQINEETEQFRIRLTDGTELTPDTILVAVGRLFNTQDLGLEKLGVALDQEHIAVDEHMLTSVPGLYAAGDVTGHWLLAHVAFAEGICAAEHALGLGSKMDYRVVPRCTFTLPEYAAVGISEAEAKMNHLIKVARFPFKSLGMGLAMGEPEGLVKIIVHAQNNQILGAHIIGPHAADLAAEIALAMRAGLPSRAIMETIHSHPTLSEAILEVAQALHGRAIHIPPDGVV